MEIVEAARSRVRPQRPAGSSEESSAGSSARSSDRAAPESAADPLAASPGRWVRRILLLAALASLALAALVVTGQRWYDQRRLDGAHQAALAAAKQTTVDFVTISAATVDRDLQRVADAATGDFKDEFTRGMPQVRAAVIENQVESSGTVLRVGLVSGDLDSAVVLVAVDASVTNVGAPEGRLSHYRIQVELALESGRWLVSRLQFIG